MFLLQREKISKWLCGRITCLIVAKLSAGLVGPLSPYKWVWNIRGSEIYIYSYTWKNIYLVQVKSRWVNNSEDKRHLAWSILLNIHEY